MTLRPVFLIFAGSIIANLGKTKASRILCMILGNTILIFGIIDILVNSESYQ